MCVIILCLSYSFLVYPLSRHNVRFEKSGPRKRGNRTENRSCSFNHVSLVIKYLRCHIGPLITLETLSVVYNQRRKWPTIYRMRLRSTLGKLSPIRPFNGINKGLWFVPQPRVCTRITRGMRNSYRKGRE